MQQKRRIFMALAAAVVASATMVWALTIRATFPARARTRIMAVVDEAGSVLFGSSTPGKVLVTNFPTPMLPPEIPLGATKASQLATIVVSTASPTCGDVGVSGATSRAFDAIVQQGGGGMVDVFGIPTGQVLVVTSFDWTVTGAPPSSAVIARLDIEGMLTRRVASAQSTALADGSGTAGGSEALGSGIVIRPGGTHAFIPGDTLCLTVLSPVAGVSGTARGFFAPDS